MTIFYRITNYFFLASREVVLLLLLSLSISSAYALTIPTEKKYEHLIYSDVKPSLEEACRVYSEKHPLVSDSWAGECLNSGSNYCSCKYITTNGNGEALTAQNMVGIDHECPAGMWVMGSGLSAMCEGTPECQAPLIYNPATEMCETECPEDHEWNVFVRACVSLPEPEGDPCTTAGKPSPKVDNPSTKAGNPINFMSGHKVQKERVFTAIGDFPLTFAWLYNSFGNSEKTGLGYAPNPSSARPIVLYSEPPVAAAGYTMAVPLDVDPATNYTGNAKSHWRHNHSYFLASYTLPDGVTERLISYRPKGSDMVFEGQAPTFTAMANPDWLLTREVDSNQVLTGWVLKHGNLIERYDPAGRITRLENHKGQGITYTYNAAGAKQQTISDDNGSSITLNYTNDKLTSITRNDGSVYEFGYNANGMLSSITYPGVSVPQKQFRYEDTRFPKALTGVTDEKGQVYSTFTYNAEGRAIRTEHASGAESVDVEYLDSLTRRLTNALGKSTTYHFQEVAGAKRIVSVDGEPSANCAAANKGYTYDSNGFIASETDWEGNVTSYTRDSFGRELSRTEADGTSEARTTTTEWHVDFDLPTKITSPSTITTFSYDGAGNLLQRKTISR